MKKFMVFVRDIELCVYADTKEEARKRAIPSFISQLKKELEVFEVKARTERCDICQYTYNPSEIVKRDGEQLCWFCNQDKYHLDDLNLSDIDIPF